MTQRQSIKVQRTCRTCGKRFLVFPSNIADGRGIYCSQTCYHGRNAGKSVEEWFWEHVEKDAPPDECWIWRGKTDRHGYGIFSTFMAHRVSWELHRGEIPKGLFVCHDCPEGDNPACVNPAHLWLGTNAENTADKIAKGRDQYLSGATNPASKLTAADVIEIRRLCVESGLTQAEIGAKFGVTSAQVSHLNRRTSWKHL
jgi:hypothetical protein